MDIHGECLHEYAAYELRRGLTAHTVRQRMNVLARFFASARTTAGTATQREVRHSLERIRSAATHNETLSSLRSLYRFLMAEEALLADPTAGIAFRTYTPSRRECFTEEEMERLLATCGGAAFLDLRDRALVTVLYATGMRAGECAALSLEDVRAWRGELLIRRGKGGTQRRVPLGETAARVLEAYLARRGDASSALWVTTTGHTLTKGGLWTMLLRRKRQAGIRTLGVSHTIRRACAVAMLTRGAPVRTIQRMLGHRRLASTVAYTEAAKATLARVHAASHPKARREE